MTLPRVHWYHFILMFMLVPRLSSAIQLTWSGGASDLTFTSATRCTLVVQADLKEGSLPPSWRLIWVASGGSIQPLALDPLMACKREIAQVASVVPAATPVDSAEHTTAALFCSAPTGIASTAFFLLDLPADASGKLKVAALDTTGLAPSVIESREVTFNGGVADPYPPVALHASSVHQSLQLRVTAIGSGLGTANSMSVEALDSSWSLPLPISARSDASLTGAASVAALLPACRVSIGSEDGTVSAVFLPADPQPASPDPQSGGCSAQFFEELLFPPPPSHGYTIQPKDFSFTRGFVDPSSSQYALHLFYIRHNYWYDQPPSQPDRNEKNFGHTWTTDFNSWHPNPTDTTSVKARPGKFDAVHVWAPTIVQNGPIFHMFYTGVGSDVAGGPQHQRIGVATSTDLNTWTQGDAPVLTAPQIPWASRDPLTYNHAQQLRDPFVMEDPIHPGQWLMYFVAHDSLTNRMAVGAATSTNLLSWQALPHAFSSTQRPTFQGPTTVVESPHVFRRNGQWWMPYTVGGDQVFFETTTSADPADTVAAHWTNPVWLRRVSQGKPAELQFWHASEHLKLASGYEYLAAFDDNATSIDIKGVFAAHPDSAAVDSFLLSCPQTLGVSDRDGSGDGVRMAVSRLWWGAPQVDLRLELPTRMPVRLAAFDIAGRRRSTILDRELPGGVTEVTWDGRDDDGRRVASGMYFIRLTYNKGARVSKIVMLR